MPEVNVNGVPIQYPATGDIEWGDEATEFAIQTAAAFFKLGLSTGTSVDITSTLDVTGATTLDSTLTVAGAGLFSSNLTTGGVLTASNSTNVTTAPPITFTGDTNTGIGHSAADTLDFVTGGQSRFRIEPTGQIKAVYESQVGTDYNTQLDNGYLCRAWVNFNGTLTTLLGTYTISGTTITVSITSHGLSTGNFAQLDFASGDGVDGRYAVTVINANSYTITNPVSGSTGGNVRQDGMIRASGNVSSITDNGTGDYTVNFTNDMPDVNYSMVATIGGTVSAFAIRDYSDLTTRTTSLVRIICANPTNAAVLDPSQVNVGVLR
jgi:hypothetical protein